MVFTENWTVSLNGPQWFMGVDSVMQVLFALVTLMIYFMSMKAYKFSKDAKYRHFGLGFAFMSLAYFILAISNLAIISTFYDGTVRHINFGNLFYLAHVFFALVGYSVLLLVSMKIRSKKLAVLMFAFISLFVLFSYQYYLKYHIVSLILLFFIAYQFFENYQKRRTINSGLVFVSFYLLAISEILLLSTIYVPLFYVVGNILQLLGYLAMLVMTVRVIARG